MSSNTIEISRRELVDRLFEDPVKNWSTKGLHLMNYLFELTQSPQNNTELKNIVSKFLNNVKKKYDTVSRKKDRFYEHNNNCLNQMESFPLFTSPCKRGRPTKENFDEVSCKTKRRKTEHLQNMPSASELSFAASLNYRKEGHINRAKVIEAARTVSSDELKMCLASLKDNRTALNPDLALCTFLDAQLTVHQYNIIRDVDKCKFPPYKQVSAAKTQCYPIETAFSVSEKSISVTLQELLNHTTIRLIKSIEEELLSLNVSSNLTLYVKWGIDGTSGFTNYKQRFDDASTSDSSMMVTCLVPIQLVGGCDRAQKFVFWQNPRPSSPRFCRPLHLNYVHETTEVSVQEMNRVQAEINDLVPTEITIGDKVVQVSHVMLFTMIDDKICNAITETNSTQRCYICKKTSSQFNCIAATRAVVVEENNLHFGLSLLHAWIRMFECIIHISYKLPIAKWRVTKAEDKAKVEETKARIHKQFKEKLGLIIDRPKPGYGSTNDGNTARRFFENLEVSSQITGISKNLIYRFHVLLMTLSSGHAIDEKKLENYCLKTAVMFIKLFPWYYMPTSVHKILMHSSTVIKHSLLPIGQLSEEAQEARNKDIKQYRERYSRKCSREAYLRDTFNRLLITSDPYISGLRKLPVKKSSQLFPEAINMLIPAEISLNIANTSTHSFASESEESE